MAITHFMDSYVSSGTLSCRQERQGHTTHIVIHSAFGVTCPHSAFFNSSGDMSTYNVHAADTVSGKKVV